MWKLTLPLTGVGVWETSADLARADKLPDLLNRVLDAGIEIPEADLGNIQILDQTTRELKMTVHRGFGSEFVTFFESVLYSDNYVCGATLKNRNRVIVEDVATDPIFGPEARMIIVNADTTTWMLSQTRLMIS